MKLDKQLKLYGITDRQWLKEKSLIESIQEAILGGTSIIQIREKDLDQNNFIQEAKEIKNICDKYKIPLIINDNVFVAKEIDASGVHLGQDDMDIEQARQILGPNKIIGISAHNLTEAKLAKEQGADYLGVGAIYNTSTKLDANLVSINTLKEICNSVDIPVVAIGGLNKTNIINLKDTGIVGVALVSAIFNQENIQETCKELVKTIEEVVND